MMNDRKNMPKNRYIDIWPFHRSRVALVPRASAPAQQQGVDDSYINACYIDSPFGFNDRRLIGAQGPTSVTVFDFWRMVVQENVVLIAMVCNLKEDGWSKCEKYWPEVG